MNLARDLVPAVVEIDRVEMGVTPAPHAFSAEERAGIDALYAERLKANPALWNGRVLILAEHRFEGDALIGRYSECDYAALLWLLGAPASHSRLRNGFAMGALRGADGAFVMARMAPWTANAGRVYFAAGTPDLSDVTADGRVDLEGSLLREFGEETGTPASDVALTAGWTALVDARRISLMRQIVAREPADAVAARIRAFIAREQRPEIDEVIIVRGPADVPEAVPVFLRTYLAAVWEREGTRV
ncbi:Uncharacterised protein [Starkeya nomas]|uniref:Nudix hydrolase domain-containing protein n=1 Tax=Starkeya nomas TaxID=2666134 RepID=A0A5S9NUM3_9HYPH|nr:NUDIX hydrolase [Starkeya nomas]CAA0094387.1 Uncharacterised protein [Starkeya nomas]